MPDRIDPLAGWFDLGDRKFDELPDATEARTTQPRNQESQGMQQRTGTKVVYRITTAFLNQGEDQFTAGFFGGPSLLHTPSQILSLFAGPQNAVAWAPIPGIQAGSKFVSLRVLVYINPTGGGSSKITFGVYESLDSGYTGAGTPPAQTAVSGVIVANEGAAWQDITIPLQGAPVRDNASYFLHSLWEPDAAAVAFDLHYGFAEVTWSTGGLG